MVSMENNLLVLSISKRLKSEVKFYPLDSSVLNSAIVLSLLQMRLILAKGISILIHNYRKGETCRNKVSCNDKWVQNIPIKSPQ